MALEAVSLDVWCVAVVLALALLEDSSPAQEPFLAKGGRAEAAIVVGEKAGVFDRWVAGELQRYLKQLSGAELPIVASDKAPAGKPLIALGGPQANPLAAAAQEKRQASFGGLKPDGFLLKRIELGGVPVLLAGGNGEAATMYAAYELLERLGVVFQLTNDIIPEKKPDLALPALDVRMEPAFKDRGMHCWHGIRWYMGLADFRREIDQLAKLKMNVLQFYWGMGGPWAEFSYGGKAVEMTATKESGFVAWPGASGTASSVKVGRECFPQDGYMGPPEFARVHTPQEAWRAAREFLREVIRYAHSRKVKVWLAMGEIPFVPPSAAPPGSRRGRSFYCGVALPPSDPAVLDVWEAAVRSMIESYPEADRYWVVSGSELLGSSKPVHDIPANDPQLQAFISDYARLRPLIPPKPKAAADLGLVDLDLADIAAADKLVRRIKARYPGAKLGAELIFRGGQLRALDAALPKDVALMNMVNFAGETAMSFFGGIEGRDLVVWPRITDDGCELNMQLNATMYDHDEVIPGGLRHGVTGILGQLNKARGAEQSAQYIAEGAWNPSINCRSFYERYLGRLYGPDARETLLKAFLLLEENEKALGWHGRRGLMSTWCAACRMGVGLRSVNLKDEKLKLDPQELQRAIKAAEGERAFWDGRAAHCREALELLREARPKVPAGSREELDYVIYKTEGFITVFEELSAASAANAAFDRALLAWSDGKVEEAARQFAECQKALERANRLVRHAAEQMVPYARLEPTERHILWILNKALPSHEAAQRYLAEAIARLGQKATALENGRLGLSFDEKTGTLAAIRNKLAGESYAVRDDLFEIEAADFRVGQADAKLVALERQPGTLKATYGAGALTIEVAYTLRGENHFAEKHLTLTSNRPYGLKKVVLSRPTFSAPELKIVPYRYPKFERKPGEEPTCTFFGRTASGGFFTGVEVPFDASALKEQQVTLSYAPSLKVAAGEKVACEPAYFGVYRRSPNDREEKDLPLWSESEAMVAMASAVLGPPRFGLVPMACGWHCEMAHGAYTEQSVEADMKSLDFLAECGIDWVSDSHPWGGETEKMNTLGANDKYEPGPLVRKFLEHARKLGIKVVMWPTMNNTHPWKGGKPFRADKPEWLMTPLRNANCMGSKPFLEWLTRVNLDGMATDYYKSWAMDGDFFGGGGWYTTIVPVKCPSDKHDHLPGDSNYACQHALDELVASVRKQHPDAYIWLLRPPMDLGVWSLRNADVSFTLLESGTGKNLAAGDQIRTWARVRLHRDFFPHYLDQPLLFPSRAGANAKTPSTWPSANLDYILLSALSCSPNQLYYLPTKSGIPDADKATLRGWLDWGRKNANYLNVRKDLPEWPAAGRVDGSAHIVGDRGLVFLFNSGKAPLEGQFALTQESIGLARNGTFLVTQEYPPSDRRVQAAHGEAVRWPVPGETATILRVRPGD
ncbi:MAG: hypothetical protein FJ291_17935 [Planctomycetes bacterium]|nr:hypothetical protein [Planctomycetota bacterium]